MFRLTRELSGDGARPHDASDVHNLVKAHTSIVLDWKKGKKKSEMQSIHFNLVPLKSVSTEGHLLFLTFFLSRGGSFRALMIRAEAEGTTST